MNDLTITDDSIPALIEAAIRDLAAARDIETVREIRNRAEAARVYTEKHKHAIEARNGCEKIVLLCEQRIGIELKQLGLQYGARGVGRGPEVKSAAPTSLSDLTEQTSDQLVLTR